MPYPLIGAGTARSSSVRVFGSSNLDLTRFAQVSFQWNPKEVGRWSQSANGIRVLSLMMLTDGTSAIGGGGGTGPVVPTTGQIWPRGNR